MTDIRSFFGRTRPSKATGTDYLKATYPMHYGMLCDADTITPNTIYFDPRYWSYEDIKTFLEDLQVLDHRKWCLLVKKQTGKIQRTRVEKRVAEWLSLTTSPTCP